MAHDPHSDVDDSMDRRGLLLHLATLALGATVLDGAPAAAASVADSAAQPPQRSAQRALVLRAQDGTRGQIGGNRVQFKIRRQHTGGAFATLEGTLAPGRIGAPPHRHKGIDEIARVLEGELTILVENELFRVSAGEWHLRPRGQVHAFWNAGTKPARFIEMYLPGTHEAYMRDLAALLARNAAPPPEALDALARRHDIEFLWDRLPAIIQQHNVRL